MDKTSKTETYRVFLIEALPEPLTRSSGHIQIFDNYIANTRLRLRSVRDPETRSWTRILQQRFSPAGNLGIHKLSEIYLNDDEYSRFQLFEGSEIRKNRYFHEFDAKMYAFDLYLGELWGLNTARIEFEDAGDMMKFDPPPFAAFEVTNEAFFSGETMVTKTFAEIQSEVSKLFPNVSAAPDE